MKLICGRQTCKHQWDYTGKKNSDKFPRYTGCPVCKTSVKVKSAEEYFKYQFNDKPTPLSERMKERANGGAL